MKKFLCALAVSGLAFASSANASVFNYSYTYNNGTVLSGSFNGDLNGNFINNLSDISAFVNGARLWDGPLYAHGVAGDDAGLLEGRAIVSLVPSLNNFAFTSSPIVNFGPIPAFFVYEAYAINGPIFGGPDSQYGLNGRVLASDRPVNGSFSIVAAGGVNGEVPEPHMVLLFGAALAGLALSRKTARK